MRYQRSTQRTVLTSVWIPLLCVVLLFTTLPAASAATTTYVMRQSGDFGTLNLSTGAFTKLGNSGQTPAGMGELGSNLYIGGDENGTLYQVNLSDGALTVVGNASVIYRAFGATTSSLYAVDVANGNLYSVNAATGAATLIGPTGLNLSTSDTAMSANAGVLYFAADTGSGSILYLIDTATGAATTIGNTGLRQVESMVYQNGLLYAGTEGGGLYTLDPATGNATFVANTGIDAWGMAEPASVLNVIHNFSGGQDGGTPRAGVTLDKAGNLYGTASGGGTGYGTVYQMKHKSSWTFNPLFEFNHTDGANPIAGVIFGPNGTLYGTTENGGGGFGVVFSLRPFPSVCKAVLCFWSETVLYNFTGYPDGAAPAYGDVTFYQGDIYGTTAGGGNFNLGTVFELSPTGNGWTESVLYSFSGSDGAVPANGVIFDNSGNLYGTTYRGGSYDYGTVFELMYPGYAQQCTLNNFNGSNGARLVAGLIFDQSGNLYGATLDYGENGGTVFELTFSAPCTWTLKTLYNFTGPPGNECGPQGTLAMDGAGNLYGTTYCDGANNKGNVWELTPSNGGWTYTDLYDFTGGNDGASPFSNVSVATDGSGTLYGTASGGGTQNLGVVWELVKN